MQKIKDLYQKLEEKDVSELSWTTLGSIVIPTVTLMLFFAHKLGLLFETNEVTEEKILFASLNLAAYAVLCFYLRRSMEEKFKREEVEEENYQTLLA